MIHQNYLKISGCKEWFVDSEIIAQGSTGQLSEGRQYSQSVRLHKKAFAAISQAEVESLTLKTSMQFCYIS